MNVSVTPNLKGNADHSMFIDASLKSWDLNTRPHRKRRCPVEECEKCHKPIDPDYDQDIYECCDQYFCLDCYSAWIEHGYESGKCGREEV